MGGGAVRTFASRELVVSALVAGIDGGQSSTVAVIADERGRILGRGSAGPADEIGAGKDSTRLRDAVHGALDDARRQAQLGEQSRFAAIVAGISGYDGRVYGLAPSLPSARVTLMHDAPIAAAGALGGMPGVIAIAGTGSVVYGRDDSGWSCTLGGWGFLFGDEGSALRIAVEALAMLMRAQDESDDSLAGEAHAACEFFGVASLRRLVHAFYKGEISRDRLAAFAPVVLGFESLRPIVNRGADRLALLVRMAVSAGAPARVAFVGGVFADAGFARRVRTAVLDALPSAEIVESRYEPAYGALLLAYREAGMNVPELRA
jgi:N-acetylglucosamine kinase-like BadF-type ATPase